MKVRMVLNVPDTARQAMAKIELERPRNQKGLATREAIRDYMQDSIGDLIENFREAAAAQPTDEYKEHEAKAVMYLRANGKTDVEILSWLLLQRAILKVGKGGGLTW